MPSTYSPFRYPGGKSQLYPFVKNLIELNQTNDTYIEPFAGGSATGLKLLFKGDVHQIVINDFDTSIYSVWHAIINHPDYLISKIRGVPFNYYEFGSDKTNIKYWKTQHEIYFEKMGNPTSLELAFATLFLNRTNVSGIITGGPLGGWNQQKTKISARFNKKTMIDKIMAIYAKRDSITISHLDALELIPELPTRYEAENTFIFFDPPYIDQGSKLYFSSLTYDDHNRLAKEILSLHQYKWIVTYDHAPLINRLYQSANGRYEYQLNYSANSKNRGKAPEFLFSSPITKMESKAKTVLSAI
jgi:DNA adenine methylase